MEVEELKKIEDEKLVQLKQINKKLTVCAFAAWLIIVSFVVSCIAGIIMLLAGLNNHTTTNGTQQRHTEDSLSIPYETDSVFVEP